MCVCVFLSECVIVYSGLIMCDCVFILLCVWVSHCEAFPGLPKSQYSNLISSHNPLLSLLCVQPFKSK